MKPEKQRMGRNSKFPILTDKTWADSIAMARSEPNLVREAIQKKIKETNENKNKQVLKPNGLVS